MGDIELELREKEDENQVGFRVHLGGSLCGRSSLVIV